jgi:hypothetical protein
MVGTAVVKAVGKWLEMIGMVVSQKAAWLEPQL